MDIFLQRYLAGDWQECRDVVADEEPLQITLDGFPLAVVMRTPGDDLDLVHGFLISEGILSSLAEVSRVDLEQKKNHALVFLKDDVEINLQQHQRNLYSASSCGICGKASIDAICQGFLPFSHVPSISPEVILRSPDVLRQHQSAFSDCGGIHAAGIFTAAGDCLVVREDVGRHNAVDKVIGWAWQQEIDLGDCFLQVSGRVSFEVMQKAMLARISTVAAISAPSSLAVDFLQQSGMQLFGFVRKGRFNRYLAK